MDIMRKQIYDQYSQFLAEKIIYWVDTKPKNPELRKVLTAVKEMMQYNYYLEKQILIKGFENTNLRKVNLGLRKELDAILDIDVKTTEL